MHNIFTSKSKVGKTLGAHDGGNQVAPKGASILDHVDIDENVMHEILKYLQNQQNFNGSIPEISKDCDTPLIIACKKVGIDEKPNKKHKIINLSFFQCEKSFNKIETMNLEI
jgi:hypothetical protein